MMLFLIPILYRMKKVWLAQEFVPRSRRVPVMNFWWFLRQMPATGCLEEKGLRKRELLSYSV